MTETGPGAAEISRVHFIGVGGVGMSGIASVASSQGIHVTGSDLKDSKYSRTLRSQGVEVWIGHDSDNVDSASPDVVVVSSAIPDTNPELARARELGLPIWPRAKMLAHVCRRYKAIAVAGTHGKTTISSILASALCKLDADPAFLVGGIVDEFDTNARYGSGEYCAIEADESDGSFTYLDPYVAVISNIDSDHLDHYSDIEEIRSAFAEFVSDIPEGGCVVVCGDDGDVTELMKSSTSADVVSYGLSESCDIVVSPQSDGGFMVTLPSGESAECSLSANPGVHNMLNAAAVIGVLVRIGYPLADSAAAVGTFAGVRRRFDLVGRFGGITIIDDYGHHPTEIAATLAAARGVGFARIHVLFQPHRYSRTQTLAVEFGKAFDDADRVTIMDVYSAGEAPIPGVTGKTVVDAVLAHDPSKDVSWIERRSDIVPFLAGWLRDGDLLITMGAGDVTAMGPLLLDHLTGER